MRKYSAPHTCCHNFFYPINFEFRRLVNGNVVIPIEYIQREVTVLKKLSHPNIVGLTEYIVVCYIDYLRERD